MRESYRRVPDWFVTHRTIKVNFMKTLIVKRGDDDTDGPDHDDYGGESSP